MYPEIDSQTNEEVTDEQRKMLRRVIGWLDNNSTPGLAANDVSYAVHVLETVARMNEGCTHWGYDSEMDGDAVTVNDSGVIEHRGEGPFGALTWKAALEVSEAFRKAAEVARRRVKE